MSNTEDIKKIIVETGKRVYDKGYTLGISGNVSCKYDNKIFITSSGACLGEINEKEIVTLDLDGNVIENNNIKPSTERMMHVEIYRARPEINAVIHAHPVYSTALAVSGKSELPAILAEPFFMFGKISVVKYETPSTNELAKSIAKYFEKSDAVLMANHGAAVCGRDLKETFYKLETLEFYSGVYLFSGITGKRKKLSNNKLQELLELKK